MDNKIKKIIIKIFGIGNLLPFGILSLAALFYLYNYLLKIVPSLMLNELMQSYHISSAAMLGSFSATYYYIYTPMQMPVGFLIDRFGAGIVLTLAGTCCALGMLFFANSTSLPEAELGRFLIGFGSAFGFVGMLKLAATWLPKKNFGLITGMVVSLGMVGGLFGDITLAELVKIEGWRLTSYFFTIFGTALTIAIFFLFRHHLKKQTLKESNKNPSINKILVSLFKIFREPQIWLSGLIGCLLYLPICVFAELWGIPYFREVYNFTNLHAAEAVALIFAGWVVGGPLIGWLSDKTKERRPFLTTGAALTTVALATIFYIPNQPIMLTNIALFAVGFFASSQILVFSLSDTIHASRYAGTIVAFVNLLVMLGGVLFQPLVGELLDLNWQGELSNNLHYFSYSAFQIALFILPLATLSAVFLSFFLKENTELKPLIVNGNSGDAT